MSRTALTAATIGTAAMLAAGTATGQTSATLLRLMVLGAALGAITVQDVREHRIPNRIVVPATMICGALLLVGHIDLAALAPALVLVAALLIVSVVAPAALGMGDVKLALLIAGGLDGEGTAAIAAGFALAAGYAVLLLARRGAAARATALPLAPFLAGGALLTASLP
jgi:leader peptidase (prepilin peptidase)/N-methyltransferase